MYSEVKPCSVCLPVYPRPCDTAISREVSLAAIGVDDVLWTLHQLGLLDNILV